MAKPQPMRDANGNPMGMFDVLRALGASPQQQQAMPAPAPQVVRPGGVTTEDVHTMPFAELIQKEHGAGPSLFNTPPPQQMPNLTAALTQPVQEPVAPPVQQPMAIPQAPPQAPTMPQQLSPGVAPSAPPPSMNFLQQASVNVGSAAPTPVPLTPGPAGGLLQAQDYSPAPSMPGYGMARTGSPFQAQQQAPLAAQAPATPLWNAMAGKQDPYSTEESLSRLGLFGGMRTY